jgi:hypothetical protein
MAAAAAPCVRNAQPGNFKQPGRPLPKLTRILIFLAPPFNKSES